MPSEPVQIMNKLNRWQWTALACAAFASVATYAQDAAPSDVRVQYLSESLKNQIRNEVREEIANQARQERWGVANATPAWVDRIKIDGDFRFRYQSDRLASDNTPAADYVAAEYQNDNGLSRAPDFAASTVRSNGSLLPTATTTDSRSRERIRLRLGVTSKVSDEVGVGVRLATGSSTDRVSTNQTLGNGFNKYQILLDRAFVRLDPSPYVSVQAGRMPNPWFGTEMVWSENLNFDGLSATGRWTEENATFEPYVTLGWFPIRENTPPSRGGRALAGAQVGTKWEVAPRTRIQAGLAYYRYDNMAGRAETDYALELSGSQQVVVAGARYGQYEYPVGLRQKGNTVFETNPLAVQDTNPIWGLAYDFRPVVLTLAAQFTHFTPYSLLVSAEWARNTAFDLADFRRRAGASYASVNPGGKRDAYHLKLGFGYLDVRDPGDWQVTAAYRHVGSDAVLDAFTDSDLGLGGTNLQGFVVGGQYALYRNTTVGMRYLSAKNIETTLNQSYPDAKFKVNTLQLDLNVKF